MSGLQLCFYCFLIIKGKPTGGISPARLGLLVSRVFQVAVRDGGGWNQKFCKGGFFIGWWEPKEWFSRFEPFSKLKKTFYDDNDDDELFLWYGWPTNSV